MLNLFSIPTSMVRWLAEVVIRFIPCNSIFSDWFFLCIVLAEINLCCFNHGQREIHHWSGGNCVIIIYYWKVILNFPGTLLNLTCVEVGLHLDHSYEGRIITWLMWMLWRWGSVLKKKLFGIELCGVELWGRIVLGWNCDMVELCGGGIGTWWNCVGVELGHSGIGTQWNCVGWNCWRAKLSLLQDCLGYKTAFISKLLVLQDHFYTK
jgi:hypothetical protein